MPDGNIILLDEEELKSAVERYEVTKEGYDRAYLNTKKVKRNVERK